jgi:hypothetical protein
MKIFLIRFLLFLIPILLFSILGDFIITKQLLKSKDKYYVVWNDLVFGRINSEILIYGSSRARAHINSKILEDSLKSTVYNLGIDGYSFNMEYCRHQLILNSNLVPKYIIQTLDYHTLGKKNELYLYEQFCPYFDNKIISNTTKGYRRFSWFDYNLPLVRYYGNTKQIIYVANILLRPSHNIGNRYKGFYHNNGKWTGELDKIKRVKKSLYQKLDKETICLFDNYLADLKKRNINVILVYTPEHIEGQKFISNRLEIMNLYKYFSKKYDIPLLDYSSDSLCLSKDNFFNAEHLNLKGANLFSKKLTSDLKKYIKN